MFETNTYVVLDVPEPFASAVMGIRKRHRDEFRSSLPDEITVAGSNGVGELEPAQPSEDVFALLTAKRRRPSRSGHRSAQSISSRGLRSSSSRSRMNALSISFTIESPTRQSDSSRARSPTSPTARCAIAPPSATTRSPTCWPWSFPAPSSSTRSASTPCLLRCRFFTASGLGQR
jgi:hypothetical protein